MTNREWAINALRGYWDNLSYAKLGLASFSDMIAEYDLKHPTFMEQFGAAVSKLPLQKVKDSLGDLARENPTPWIWPDINDLFKAASDGASSFSASDAKAVAVQSLADVGNVAKIGLGIWAVAAGVALVVFVFNKSKK